MPHRPARPCILLFAAALATAAPAQGQQAPAAPREKGPTTIDAERIEGVSDVEVTARGAAELKRDDFTIFGELLKYNRELGRVEGDGGVRLERPGERFSGPRLRYNILDDTGEFEQPNYLLRSDRQTSRGKAERIEFLGKDRYRMQDATFTTCEPGREDWVLEVADLELDYVASEGNAKGAWLRFFDTPVLFAPLATFPLDKRRKSGFLTPSYSQTSNRGLEVGLPYYWNIAPEQDATITPVYMGKRGPQLKGDYRYLDSKYLGEIRLEWMPEDRVLKRARHGLSLVHEHRFLPNLTGRIELNNVSDQRYFVDLSSSLRQVSITNLVRDAWLSYSGAIGDQGYGVFARLQGFQTLQDPQAPITPPYHRVPQVNFSTARNDIGGLLDASVLAEYARFTHPSLVEGRRIALNPTFSTPFLAPGWFFTPRLGLRHADYDLSRTAPGQAGRQSVTVPWMSLDAGLVFERDAHWFGQNVVQTLEPRAFYVRAPFRNQDQIPLFDTGVTDFNYAQLFSENRFSGNDRFGDADQLTLALTSRLLGQGGQEGLRGTVGQRYYFQSERVGITAAAPLRTYKDSDLIASIGGHVARSWSFDATTQFNPRDERTERYSVSLRYAPEIAKVLNASYRFNRNVLRQVDLSGQWPVAPGWYAVGRYNYSLLDKRLVEGLAGFEYNAGCWVFRGVVQRLQAITNVTSTGFFFQVEFNGFGQIGVGDVVDLLKRNVPGYAVTNPRDPGLVPQGLRSRLPFEQVF
jgi:LPS-assembly protein